MLRPALRHARVEKKLPRLTATAFANLTLTAEHQSRRRPFFAYCYATLYCLNQASIRANALRCSKNAPGVLSRRRNALLQAYSSIALTLFTV
ncbi:hypothetical protein PANT111_170248 [Pantoea brenneri]|uniref:Uncharacterized protein n=1 Tax=Pantoea brenneri TaxID=472694 RepID=A0AAX3J5Q9_9GAMM|nr:hypothetical protein PANT111_170248 [Pantoea brenneri]